MTKANFGPYVEGGALLPSVARAADDAFRGVHRLIAYLLCAAAYSTVAQLPSLSCT
jgi:hypothetical protein